MLVEKSDAVIQTNVLSPYLCVDTIAVAVAMGVGNTQTEERADISLTKYTRAAPYCVDACVMLCSFHSDAVVRVHPCRNREVIFCAWVYFAIANGFAVVLRMGRPTL